MSSEWTVVKSKKRVAVVETVVPKAVQASEKPIVENRKSKEEKQREWEAKQQENKAKWEANRQAKLDEYNAMFPLLPGSKDLVSDKNKIAYIDARRADKKEADRQAYLKREAKREEKRKLAAKREAELEKIRKENHVPNMIEKWGAHRWFRMVEDTEDDCDLARQLRHEEQERDILNEMRYRERERKDKEEWEQQIINDQKYIDEKTADMSPEDKAKFIRFFEEEKLEWLEARVEAEGDLWHKAFMKEQRQKEEDAIRLAEWERKNKK